MIDDDSTIVANESRSENNTSREPDESAPIDMSQRTNGSDKKTRDQGSNHELIQDVIVISSSDYDDPESSLSPAPSTVVSDPFDPSYSPRSPSSDGRNKSVDPAVLDEDFDIGDYNDPPRSPSDGSNGLDGSESDRFPQETAGNGFAGTARSPTAVDALRAIQAEMIPGYEGGDARDEHSTGATARSDPTLLFPGLPTRHTREEPAAQ